MYRYIYILIFILFCTNANAYNIDSLKNAYNISKGINKVETAIKIADEYSETDFNQSLNYIDQALKVSLELKNDTLINKSLLSKATILFRNKKKSEALSTMNLALTESKKARKQKTKI
ncbi:MAG: hypothetical protein HY951_08880 [Bacteroidia bacterium]|nr:hypothetical protein [Bacteroidia bacterium]